MRNFIRYFQAMPGCLWFHRVMFIFQNPQKFILQEFGCTVSDQKNKYAFERGFCLSTFLQTH